MGRYSELVDGNNLKNFPAELIPGALKIIADFYAANPEKAYPVNGSQAERDAFMRQRLGALKATQGKLTLFTTDSEVGQRYIKNQMDSAFGFTSFEQNIAAQNARTAAYGTLQKAAQTFFYSQLTVADQNVMIEYALRLDRGGNDDDAFISHSALVFAGYVAGAAILATVGAGAVTTLAGGAGAGGAAAASTGAATESGTLLGSTGLLAETGTVTAYEGAALATPTLTLTGTEAASGGLVASLLAGASEQGGNLLDLAKNQLLDSVLNPPKSQPAQVSQPAPVQPIQDSISILKLLPPLGTALLFLLS